MQCLDQVPNQEIAMARGRDGKENKAVPERSTQEMDASPSPHLASPQSRIVASRPAATVMLGQVASLEMIRSRRSSSGFFFGPLEEGKGRVGPGFTLNLA
jgi:hypothetical protein